MTDGLAPRLAAWRSLQAQASRHKKLNETSQDADSGLARELSSGVLRHRLLYRSLIKRFLRQGGKLDNKVWWILEIVCHQAFALNRIPSQRAIVATAVALAKKMVCIGNRV